MRVGRLVRSLRARLALAGAAAAALALALAGVFVVQSVGRAERARLDDALVDRADRAAGRARERLAGPGPPPRVRRSLVVPEGLGGPPGPGRRGDAGRPGDPGGPDPPDGRGLPDGAREARRGRPLLGPAGRGRDGEAVVVRLVAAGGVRERGGDLADPGLPTRAAAEPRTVDIAGAPWRVVQAPVAGPLAVQAAAPLGPARARADALRDRVLVAVAGGTLLTLALAWLLAAPALRALGRLREAATGVARTADLTTRVDDGRGPQEVRDVGAALNAMLARLQAAEAERTAALEATRRFAADAGHELRTPLATIGAGVSSVAGHPTMPADDRAAALGDVLTEHERAVALLAALQALARGDAAGRLDRAPVDVVDVVEAVLAHARRDVGDRRLALEAPEALVLDAWEPGVRLAVENLVRNALVHGGGGSVQVTVAAHADGVAVTVDDDGPGIPAGEREAVRGRFVRGSDVTAPGSGLGLALVDQQARLHGGRLDLEHSARGGLRATLVLARS